MTNPSAIAACEDLSRFRFHTGATLRRLGPEEPCRLLFRDIGSLAMEQFLRGRLQRLAGPYAPILYTRTANYQEAYTDHEPVGRLVFLRPTDLHPWHSGVAEIYVASLRQPFDSAAIGFVPAHVSLTKAECALQGVSDVQGLRDAFGGREYDGATAETLATLQDVNRELANAEKLAEPLRRMLQSRRQDESAKAKSWLARRNLTESDLCSAWHRLPRARRALFLAALAELESEAPS